MNEAKHLLERAAYLLGFATWVPEYGKLRKEIEDFLSTQESEGNELGVSEKDRKRLFYGFLLDCNAIGPESAGVNLARGIKALLKHHGIGGGDE